MRETSPMLRTRGKDHISLFATSLRLYKFGVYVEKNIFAEQAYVLPNV